MRASGLTAWVFLILTVIWGALISGRLVRGAANRQWLLDLHPYLGSLGLGALVLHVVSAVMDTTVHLTWRNTVVPFTSKWEPFAVGLGVLAIWMLAIVELTSVARRFLPKKTWHSIHLLSYVMAWFITIHAVISGTDMRNRFVSWTGIVLVILATTVGIRRYFERPPTRRSVSEKVAA